MLDRAGGIFVMAIFGGVWWLLGSGPVPGVGRLVVLAVGAVALLALLGAGWRARRSRPPSPRDPAAAAVGVPFALVNVGQGIAIAAVALGAGAADRAELIPALVCFVVGVHFLPLAGLFDVPRYRVTGGALVALAVVTFAVVPTLSLPAGAWQALPGFGAALVLWATSASLAIPATRG